MTVVSLFSAVWSVLGVIHGDHARRQNNEIIGDSSGIPNKPITPFIWWRAVAFRSDLYRNGGTAGHGKVVPSVRPACRYGGPSPVARQPCHAARFTTLSLADCDRQLKSLRVGSVHYREMSYIASDVGGFMGQFDPSHAAAQAIRSKTCPFCCAYYLPSCYAFFMVVLELSHIVTEYNVT